MHHVRPTSFWSSLLLTTLIQRVSDKPVQMDEAAESRISLSTRHVGGRYTDDNADVDSEASVGLLTRESDAIMEDEGEKTGRWRKPAKKGLYTCCGIK